LLATSASTILGSLIGGYLAPTLSNIPIVGDLLVTFIEIFISGMLSCTLIYFIDKWNIAKKIVDFIQSLDVNPFGEYVESMKQRVAAYEAYVAKLLEVDVDSVVRETKRYAQVVSILQSGNDDAITNYKLKALFKDLEITLPWKGDFSSFMSDKNNQLVFE